MTCYIIFLCLILCVSNTIGIRKRIVGGTTTNIEHVPYQISLQYKGKHYCGGSIIGSKFVLTAAHCVQGRLASDYRVRAGSYQHSLGGELIPVQRIFVHERFNWTTAEYDLAVLILNKCFKWSSKIKPIPLAQREPYEGERILISGWGALFEGFNSYSKLQSVQTPIMNRIKCQNALNQIISKNKICAGYTSGGKDSCQGDSGGPAVIRNTQVGIISWGIGCGRINSPGIFTNIAQVRSWIITIMSSF